MYPTVELTMPIADVLRRGHPWVFADAVRHGEHRPGDVVDVLDAEGDFVGRGIIEPDSPLRVRLWTTRPEVRVDNKLLDRRIRAAAKRRPFPRDDTTGYRLLNGEGDRTPGLTCDIYGDVAVFRVDGVAAERWLKPARRVVEKVAGTKWAAVRRSEIYRGDHDAAEWMGDAPPSDTTFMFREHGLTYLVDPIAGQKTGFFLDQRANRARIAEMARGKRLLNLFAYTGGFSVAAAASGAAHTTTIDLAKPAVADARRNFELNGIPAEAHAFEAIDVFEYLERFDPGSAPFEVAVCDPPSFAHRRDDVPRATAAYTRLFARLLEVMPTASTVALASCSSQIDRERFADIVAAAAVEANVALVAQGLWGADIDHATTPAFVEGDYLQFMICHVARD
jgi:23S rRNA (cytosine1962-C5)-methyltransferase